ncbi:MAG: hypothetical protein LBQ88_23175 [Treponema sp.]|nr:hypothetical protein [Treponema sp.]
MASFKVEYQTPRPRIEIIPPPYDGSITVWLTPADPGITTDRRHIDSNNLLSYAFSEAVDDLEGSFSFSIENEMIKPAPGKSLFDLIPLRSVVNIYEDDYETPAFRGIIRKRHTGATMTSNGVKKSVVFSGKSIISCITEFMVPLDVRIPGVSNSTAKTKQLQSELSENPMTIESFMKKTWEFFRRISDEVSQGSGLTNGLLLQLIDNDDFIGKDFVKVTGKETFLQYPVATMFYNQTNNYITDVWRNILPKPAYELFTRFDNEKKRPVIIARQAPYGDPDNGNHDWLDLKLYYIDPASLTGYDLDQSDEEVYTAFNSYVVGSPKAKEFYQVVSDTVDPDMAVNKDKSAIYGFKLLSVSFTGFDRMQNEDAEKRKNELTDALQKLDLRTKYWFSRLDEMYSGTITLITSFKKKGEDRSGRDLPGNPRAGCRVSFLGGQFYVEKSEHSWQYGRTPVNRLSVSRGMVYDANGKIKEEIPGIGKLYGELDG